MLDCRREPVGEEWGKSSLADGAGCCSNVVRNTDNSSRTPAGIQQRKRSAGVAIARLADTPGIDDVPLARPEIIHAPIRPNNCGDMGMTDAADGGHEISELFLDLGPGEHVVPFSRVFWGGMDKCYFIFADGQGEFPDVRKVFVGQPVTCPGQCGSAVLLEVLSGEESGNAGFMVAANNGRAVRAHKREAFIRVGAVADCIAEADNPFGAQGIDLFEDTCQGVEVSVDVGQYGDAHGG